MFISITGFIHLFKNYFSISLILFFSEKKFSLIFSSVFWNVYMLCLKTPFNLHFFSLPIKNKKKYTFESSLLRQEIQRVFLTPLHSYCLVLFIICVLKFRLLLLG